MNISSGILFGIIAMLGWGVSDFFVAKAVRKTTVLKTTVWSQLIGMILFFLLFPFFLEIPRFSFIDTAIILISGVIGILALLAFFKGLQKGKISIVSPIASSYAALTVILSFIFLGEKLNALQTAGVSLAILGAVLTSLRFHGLIGLKIKNIGTGVKYGLIAMIGWGTIFVFIGFLVSKFGWFLPIFLIELIGLLFLLAYSGATAKNISFPKNAAIFVVLIGILRIAGFLSYGFGISSELTSIVAPVSSTYPIITIILARIFFKEVLEISQKIGVVSVIIGLVLLSV
ncbi:DMT family transporter [Candidatus Woesearchaeota archaeon]|nr:DMT family transporter [Candidatus Woesearchaeota archaeon]